MTVFLAVLFTVFADVAAGEEDSTVTELFAEDGDFGMAVFLSPIGEDFAEGDLEAKEEADFVFGFGCFWKGDEIWRKISKFN